MVDLSACSEKTTKPNVFTHFDSLYKRVVIEMKNDNVVIRMGSVIPPQCVLKALSVNLCC